MAWLQVQSLSLVRLSPFLSLYHPLNMTEAAYVTVVIVHSWFFFTVPRDGSNFFVAAYAVVILGSLQVT